MKTVKVEFTCQVADEQDLDTWEATVEAAMGDYAGVDIESCYVVVIE